MYVLVCCCERDMDLIGVYNTIDKARIAMHNDLILSMDETDQSMDWINEVKYDLNGKQHDDNLLYNNGDVGVYAWSAYANFDDNYDWQIFKI